MAVIRFGFLFISYIQLLMKLFAQERRVVSCLLTLLDNLGQSGCRVVVLAATNKIDKVDSALRRPGRFDFEVELGVPTGEGRRDILDKMLEGIPHSLEEEQLNLLARDTHGFVGADIQVCDFCICFMVQMCLFVVGITQFG